MSRLADFERAIADLTNDQLKEVQVMVNRLQSLDLPPGSRFDLLRLVDEVKYRPRPATDGGTFDPLGKDHAAAAHASSGRYYELLAVLGVPEGEARTQYKREWREARRLVADGLKMDEAWSRIRRQARMASLLDDDDEPRSRRRVRVKRKRRSKR